MTNQNDMGVFMIKHQLLHNEKTLIVTQEVPEVPRTKLF